MRIATRKREKMVSLRPCIVSKIAFLGLLWEMDGVCLYSMGEEKIDFRASTFLGGDMNPFEWVILRKLFYSCFPKKSFRGRKTSFARKKLTSLTIQPGKKEEGLLQKFFSL